MNKGFSLIEMILVLGILAVLLTLVLIAVNPSRQFQQSNNTKRSSDITAILNAIHQYSVDNRGSFPTGIPTASPIFISNFGANLCASLVTRYLAALPTDPTATAAGAPITNCGGAYNTGYTVIQSASDNRITIYAPNAQLNAAIYVTR